MSGLCGALLRSRPEAEDATQQTFLSAHRALLNGSEPLEPAAWLATIARNECRSRIRTRMRQPLAAEPVDTVSTEPDPLAEAIRRADLAALWQAIEALPPQQRDALLLREFGGLSYGELAAALSVSAPAVESLLFRARQRLRAELRAAYASFAGASCLETLARAFAGGGAPVAAKVAALGVGAAAVTGGAVVVAPDVLERAHHRTPPPAVRQAPVRHASLAPARVSHAGAAIVVQLTQPRPSTLPQAEDSRRDGGGGVASHDSSRSTEGLRETSGGSERSAGTDGSGSGSSGLGSSRSSSSGSGDSGSGSSGSGSSGSGDSRDGGAAGVTVLAPAADPVATVTVETSDGGGGGGDDGHSGSGGG